MVNLMRWCLLACVCTCACVKFIIETKMVSYKFTRQSIKPNYLILFNLFFPVLMSFQLPRASTIGPNLQIKGIFYNPCLLPNQRNPVKIYVMTKIKLYIFPDKECNSNQENEGQSRFSYTKTNFLMFENLIP